MKKRKIVKTLKRLADVHSEVVLAVCIRRERCEGCPIEGSVCSKQRSVSGDVNDLLAKLSTGSEEKG
jgi:hypothetical protein